MRSKADGWIEVVKKYITIEKMRMVRFFLLIDIYNKNIDKDVNKKSGQGCQIFLDVIIISLDIDDRIKLINETLLPYSIFVRKYINPIPIKFISVKNSTIFSGFGDNL